MNEFLYRPQQELDKIGHVFSSKDEKQRLIAEEIRNLRLKGERNVLINQNIEGLDKKPKFTLRNPASARFFNPFFNKGRNGVVYVYHQNNISRLMVPLFLFASWYYICENYFRGQYYKLELNNNEAETCYFKIQTFSVHMPEKHTLMS